MSAGWAQWRLYVAPAYLMLAILLGGAPSQGPLAEGVLQLFGLAILLWAFLVPPRAMVPPMERRLNFLIAATLVLVACQLVPIPPDWWARLPLRGALLNDERALGLSVTAWRPISLSPTDTIDGALKFIPPLAMFAALLKLEVHRQRYLAVALFGCVAAAILLGTLQVSANGPNAHPFYPYPRSNFGLATGFFANANHMALLLLVAIPFATATASAFAEQRPGYRADAAIFAALGSTLLLLLVGLYLNGSLFGYAMAVPVLGSSVLMLWRSGRGRVKRSLLMFALLAGLGLAAMTGAQRFMTIEQSTRQSIDERQRILVQSVELLRQAGPTGTGLGSFVPVSLGQQDRKNLGQTYANAAHNDYVQWGIEMGWAGMALGVLFLLWWIGVLLRLRTSSISDQYAWASAIGSGTILLHSLVEYPLRTGSMAVVFAMCLALMLQSRRHLQGEKDLRATRHVVVE